MKAQTSYFTNLTTVRFFRGDLAGLGITFFQWCRFSPIRAQVGRELVRLITLINPQQIFDKYNIAEAPEKLLWSYQVVREYFNCSPNSLALII